MAETTFAPTTVIDSSKIFDPILQSQMQQVAFAKNQVENLQSGIASIAKNIGQIKMAGEQNDQMAMKQMQDKLSKDWTDAMVKYQGNIPVDQQIKFQGALNGLNNLADMYAEDKKTVDQLRNQMTSAFSKGNITRESWDRFQNDLAQRQSLPVWERTPINLPDYMEQKQGNEQAPMLKLISASTYTPGTNEETGEKLYDSKQSKSVIKKLIESDDVIKGWYNDVMKSKGLDPEKDMNVFLNDFDEAYRAKFPNSIKKDDEDKGGFDYQIKTVPPAIPEPNTPVDEAVKIRSGYGEIPVVINDVPYNGKKYDVLGVRIYPNGKSDVVVQINEFGVIKTTTIPYDEISAGMLAQGRHGKRWTAKNHEAVKSASSATQSGSWNVSSFKKTP